MEAAAPNYSWSLLKTKGDCVVVYVMSPLPKGDLERRCRWLMSLKRGGLERLGDKALSGVD